MLERVYEDTFPNALMMGVDSDLFWTLDPKSLKPYIKAFRLKEELLDRHAWEEGIYIQKAIASVLNGKRAKYPEKPFYSEIVKKELTVEEKRQALKDKILFAVQNINAVKFGK